MLTETCLRSPSALLTVDTTVDLKHRHPLGYINDILLGQHRHPLGTEAEPNVVIPAFRGGRDTVKHQSEKGVNAD